MDEKCKDPNYYEIACRVNNLLADNGVLVNAALEHCRKDSVGLDAIAAILEIRQLMTEICRKEHF